MADDLLRRTWNQELDGQPDLRGLFDPSEAPLPRSKKRKTPSAITIENNPMTLSRAPGAVPQKRPPTPFPDQSLVPQPLNRPPRRPIPAILLQSMCDHVDSLPAEARAYAEGLKRTCLQLSESSWFESERTRLATRQSVVDMSDVAERSIADYEARVRDAIETFTASMQAGMQLFSDAFEDNKSAVQGMMRDGVTSALGLIDQASEHAKQVMEGSLADLSRSCDDGVSGVELDASVLREHYDTVRDSAAWLAEKEHKSF